MDAHSVNTGGLFWASTSIGVASNPARQQQSGRPPAATPEPLWKISRMKRGIRLERARKRQVTMGIGGIGWEHVHPFDVHLASEQRPRARPETVAAPARLVFQRRPQGSPWQDQLSGKAKGSLRQSQRGTVIPSNYRINKIQILLLCNITLTP